MQESTKNNMEELLGIIKKLNMDRDDVIMEAECVEEYGSWIHMELMWYTAEQLFEAADMM